MQAVVAFSKLSKSEHAFEDYELPDGHDNPLDTLAEVANHDPAAYEIYSKVWKLPKIFRSDVRREAAISFPAATSNIQFIIERIRDAEASVRKAVYALALEPNVMGTDGVAKAYHPLELEERHRNLIIAYGMKDRDEGVRKACAKLTSKWLDSLSFGVKTEDQPIEKILPLLALFDLSCEPAELILNCIFGTRADIFLSLKFDGTLSID